MQEKQFHSAIELNHELLALLMDEQLVPHLGEHYHIMARLYIAAQDRKNARKYGRLALTDLEAYGDPSTAATVEELKEMLRVL